MPNSWDDWLDSAAQNPVNAAIQRAGWKRPVRAPRPQVPTPNDFVGAEPPDITDEQRSKIFDETEWSRSGSSPYDVMRTIKEQGETSDPDGPSFMDEYDAAVKRAQASRPGMKEYVDAKDAAEHATRMQAFAPTPDPNYRRGGSPPPPDRSNEMPYEAAPRMDFSQVDANRGSADRAQAEEAAARLRRIQGLGYGATPPPPPPQRTMETPSEATRPDFLWTDPNITPPPGWPPVPPEEQRAKPGEFGYQSMKGSPGEMSGPLGTSYPHWSGAQEIPYGKEHALQENPVGLDPARPNADFAQHTNFGGPGGDTWREDAHSMQSSLDALGARKAMGAAKAEALDQDWAEANPEAAARGEHELPGNRTFLDRFRFGTSRQALGDSDQGATMTLIDRLFKEQTEAKASEEAKKAADAEKARRGGRTPEQVFAEEKKPELDYMTGAKQTAWNAQELQRRETIRRKYGLRHANDLDLLLKRTGHASFDEIQSPEQLKAFDATARQLLEEQRQTNRGELEDQRQGGRVELQGNANDAAAARQAARPPGGARHDLRLPWRRIQQAEARVKAAQDWRFTNSATANEVAAEQSSARADLAQAEREYEAKLNAGPPAPGPVGGPLKSNVVPAAPSQAQPPAAPPSPAPAHQAPPSPEPEEVKAIVERMQAEGKSTEEILDYLDSLHLTPESIDSIFPEKDEGEE